MSVESQSFYVPAESGSYAYGTDYSDYGNTIGSYGNSYVVAVPGPTRVYAPAVAYAPGFVMQPQQPPNITQTIVNPVPKVSEIHINELLPFQVTPTYTVNRWVVRSNVADRGGLARHMLLAWRPESLDYGSDVDSTTLPQVYLFQDEKGRVQLQQQLYNDYPELNLQSYTLKVPVRIATHTYPGANLVSRDSYIIPGNYYDPRLPSALVVPAGPPTINTTAVANYTPIELPPEVTNLDGNYNYNGYNGYDQPANTVVLSRAPPLLPRVSAARKSRATASRRRTTTASRRR